MHTRAVWRQPAAGVKSSAIDGRQVPWIAFQLQQMFIVRQLEDGIARADAGYRDQSDHHAQRQADARHGDGGERQHRAADAALRIAVDALRCGLQVEALRYAGAYDQQERGRLRIPHASVARRPGPRRLMLRFAANISLLFRELPLLERFAAARDAGFAAVEMQFPYAWPAARLAAAAQAAGLPVVLINAPIGSEAHLPGIACRREHRDLFRAELARAAEYAAALRVPCVSILAGNAAAAERSDCLLQLSDNLARAAEVLAGVGCSALIEPLNSRDWPASCVPDLATAGQLLANGDRRLRLQYDIYHLAQMDLDPAALWLAWCDRVGHVQFSDSPGRHEPGTGKLPFPEIFRAIANSRYAAWVGAEYHPLHSTAASLGWLRTPTLPQ